MAIVTFYNGDPKDAPKTTMPARLGANAIITCKNRLLLEAQRFRRLGPGWRRLQEMGDRPAGNRPGSL